MSGLLPAQNAETKAAMTTILLTIRMLLVFIPWVLQLLLADLALSALLPATTVQPSLTYHLASVIAESIWAGIQYICVDFNEARIILTGDALPHGESAIVVSNHIEWCDFYMIQALAQRSGMLGHCRWFAKQQLKWVPFLGWGLWAMGMPLVSRNWTEDKPEMDRVFHGITVQKWPVWLISFSEATRFTATKYDEAVAWCTANNKPVPKHTLHPRVKGFVATVKNLRKAPHVKAVYDVTIAYSHSKQFMSPPSFFDTIYRPNLHRSWRMYAHVNRYELASLPESDQELASWLEASWAEKGRKLTSLETQLRKGEQWGEHPSIDMKVS
ncbi:hypothetical protein MBLNU457_g0811t1 [Dothideomycetes sp. NU457]